MSTDLNCPNRIKPKLLREVKTEALLVLIRTILEQLFYHIDNEIEVFKLESKIDNEFVLLTLRELLCKLQDCVVSSTYLVNLIDTHNKNTFLLKKEEPLMYYYNALVNGIKINFKKGNYWIPELIVISLLSEWILEEEKSVYLYPFLSEINYLDLANRYDKGKKDLDIDKKEAIISMYRISSSLIIKLKSSRYKINTKRKKKSKR